MGGIEEHNKRDEQYSQRMELINTLVLSIATLSVAWCSYQATLWGGIQTFKLSENNGLNRKIQQDRILETQQRVIEEGLVISFVEAVVHDDKPMIDYYVKGIKTQFGDHMKDWLVLWKNRDTSTPTHPMAMPEFIRSVESAHAKTDSLRERAQHCYQEAQMANSNSDKYSLLTVLFSMVMFLGAIATKLRSQRLSNNLIYISITLCMVTLFFLFFFMPIATE